MTSLPATATVPDGSTEAWRDHKRYLWLIGLVVPGLSFVGALGYGLSGWSAFFWLGPIVILIIVPLIDLFAGVDRNNPPDDVIEALEKDRYYRWITYAYLPLQYIGFIATMAVAAGRNPGLWFFERVGLGPWAIEHLPALTAPLSTMDKVGLAVSIGCVGGIGINTAHELGHKRESVERWLSKIALAQSAYGHFYIEHNRGHHVRVATPNDPASSRLGENFYAFWPRTVFGSLKSAWNLEKRRYARHKKHPFQLGNDVLNAWLMTAVLWGALILWLGPIVLPFLVIQAIVGFSLLEVVNYMEHYGMLRQRVGVAGKERYERVDPSHSWNSNNIATNVLLYHLQRHSDHHANPTRRYQSLRDYAESPVLPTGYAGMIVLALFPPLWRRVMDPRVVGHYGGDVTLANIDPRHRDKVLARWGRSEPAPRPESAPAADASARAQSESEPGRTGHRCPGCGWTYAQDTAAPREGFPAGTPWTSVPDNWCCPDCGVREKVDFMTVDLLST